MRVILASSVILNLVQYPRFNVHFFGSVDPRRSLPRTGIRGEDDG